MTYFDDYEEHSCINCGAYSGRSFACSTCIDEAIADEETIDQKLERKARERQAWKEEKEMKERLG